MAASKWFEWIIILVSTVTILGGLASGGLGLRSAPAEWRSVTREADLGQFWVFIVAMAIVTLALIIDVLVR